MVGLNFDLGLRSNSAVQEDLYLETFLTLVELTQELGAPCAQRQELGTKMERKQGFSTRGARVRAG